MVLNLGCTLEPILCEVWKYWYPCRNPGQLKQNSGKKPFLLFFFSFFFFLSSASHSNMQPKLRTTIWAVLIINRSGNHLHTFQNCFFPLIVLPWVNFMSSPLCYSFLNPFVSKKKGKKDTSSCYLKGDFNNKTSDVCYSYLEFTLKFSYLKFQHMYFL